MYALLTAELEDTINQLFDNIQEIDKNTVGQQQNFLVYLIKRGWRFTWSIPAKQKMYRAVRQMKTMPCGYKNYTVVAY